MEGCKPGLEMPVPSARPEQIASECCHTAAMSAEVHPDHEEILSADDRAAARKKLEALLLPAIDAIEETIIDGTGGVRLSAAKLVVDFNFGKDDKAKDDFLEKLYGDITKKE